MNIISNIASCFYQKIDTQRCDALRQAIDNGDLAGIENAKDTLNQPFPYDNQLPLIYAIKANKIDAVKALLQNGALSSKKLRGEEPSPIEYALLAKNHEATVCLISHMISDSMENVEKALDHPSSRQSIDIAVRSIKSAYSDRKRKDLAKEVQKRLEQSFPEQKFDGITKHGENILHLAIQSNSFSLLEKCLQDPRSQAFINRGDQEGFTPLHYAIAFKNITMIKALCLAGAKIDALSHSDLTPLMLIAADAETNSPLYVSRQKELIFICSAVIWIANLQFSKAIDGDLRYPLHLLETGFQIFPLFSSFSDLKSAFLNTALLATSCYLTPSRGTLGAAYTGIMASILAAEAFKGLSHCLKYRELGVFQALKRAVVIEGTKLTSAFRMIHTIGAVFGQWKPFLSDVLREAYENGKLCDGHKYSSNCVQAHLDTAVICHTQSREACDQARYDLNRFVDIKNRIDSVSCYSNNHDYRMECYSKKPNVRRDCRPYSRHEWRSALTKECGESIQAFEKFQETESQYVDTYDKCAELSNYYFIKKDCKNLGVEKIQTCFEDETSSSCNKATESFNNFLENPPREESYTYRILEELNFNNFNDESFSGQKTTKDVDYYSEITFAMEELELKWGFSKDECLKKFRAYVLKHHPDKNGGAISESLNRINVIKDELCNMNL